MAGNVINTQMSAADKFKNDLEVDAYNKKLDAELREGRKSNHELGKDDFLKILIAQMSNQDPTSPMENTEFIAQMAQFSSLEQMKNMSQNFEKLAVLMNSTEAQNYLGKTVDIDIGDTTTTGMVTAATRDAKPQVMVNGAYYDMERIKTVYGM